MRLLSSSRKLNRADLYCLLFYMPLLGVILGIHSWIKTVYLQIPKQFRKPLVVLTGMENTILGCLWNGAEEFPELSLSSPCSLPFAAEKCGLKHRLQQFAEGACTQHLSVLPSLLLVSNGKLISTTFFSVSDCAQLSLSVEGTSGRLASWGRTNPIVYEFSRCFCFLGQV